MEQIPGNHENFHRHLALPMVHYWFYAASEGKYIGLWIMPSEGGKSRF
ncbi:MAG TPA: hypothetical protein VGA29_03980 [Ignavibacteriaceae bacterium]